MNCSSKIPLFNSAPFLLPISKNFRQQQRLEESSILFKGYIDVLYQLYFIEIKARLNENNGKLTHIELYCESILNNLLKEVTDLLNQRLQKPNSIQEFISELKNIIEFQLKKSYSQEQSLLTSNDLSKSLVLYKRLVDEIGAIGWNNLVCSNEAFNKFVFKYYDMNFAEMHNLFVELTDSSFQRGPLLRTELPDKFQFNWTENSTLLEVYQTFVDEINGYGLFWEEMRILDDNCWILEPLKPTRVDTRRRICIADNVSVQLTVDPKHPKEMPEITFFGSETLKRPFEEKYEANFGEWNSGTSILYNLEELLDIKLPRKSNQLSENVSNNEIECGICYSYLYNEKGPNEFCGKCNKPYHDLCLNDWLKSSSKSKIDGFGFLWGECPYCVETIKIKVNST